MSRVAYIRAWPRDPATGATGLVAMAGGGSHVPYLLDNLHYRAGVVREPRFAAALGFDDKGWTGAALPTVSVMTFAPADPALLRAYAALYWKDAPVEVDAGEEYAGVGRILTGTIGDAEVRDGQLVISIADLGAKISKPIIQSWFAGTGGIEGDAAAEGRVKRRSYGYVKGIEGRPLLAAYNICEFGDLSRPSQDMPVIRHKGREGFRQVLGWQGSIVATLDALKASSPQEGGGVVAPSINCAKWWTDPQGAPLTADLLGDNALGYVDRPAAIAARLLNAAGGPAIANLAQAVAMRDVVAGLHIGDDSETTSAALDRLLLPVSLLWRFGTVGLIDIREWSWDGDAELIQGRFIARTKTLPPTKTRRLGYDKNHRPHSPSEIAADILAAGAAYDDGTPIEQLRPAEAGANVTGSHTSAAFQGQGALATRNDVIFGSHITSLPAAISPSNLIDGNYLSAGFGRYLDGVTLQMLRPGEAGANVTEGRTAAAFQGQGQLATLNGLAFGSPMLTGFGSLAGLGSLFFGSPFFLEGAGGATATLSAFKTALGVASGFFGQGPWATYSKSISQVIAPAPNMFPYPRPTRDDRAPPSYGWGIYVTAGVNEGWGPVSKYDGNANGGAIYVVSRNGNFGACTLAPYFDIPLRDPGSWVAGQRRAAISLNGYASNGSFAPIADYINGAKNQTFERVSLALNPSANRYEGVLGPCPAGAEYVRVYAGHANFPAFNGYQDSCFWDIKVEPDAVTPYQDVSENRSLSVEWATGQMLNALRPGEFGANVTEGRTAAAFYGQGALATLSSLALGGGFLTGFGSLAGTDRVRLGVSGGMVNEANNAWLTDGSVITGLGVAASFQGQSPWATYSGLNPSNVAGQVSRLQTDGFIQSTTIYRSVSGSFAGFLHDWWPEDQSSNRTEGRTSAAFQGQGQLATRNNLGWTDALFTGRPQYLTDVVDRPGYPGEKSLRSDYIVNPDQNVALVQRWPQEGGANVTEGRTAAAFQGQGAFATQSWINSGNVASFFAYSAFRLSFNITRFDGSTIVTESMVVTMEGVSAGFMGQGRGATANDLAGLDPDANSVLAGLAQSGPLALTVGYNEPRIIAINAGQGRNFYGAVYVDGDNGSQPGNIAARILWRARSGGGWNQLALGTARSVGPGEPGGANVSANFVNNTGVAQIFEFMVDIARTGFVGGNVVAGRSYLNG